jgi:hypothetical protein
MAGLGVHCLPFPSFVKMKEGTEKDLVESCEEKTGRDSLWGVFRRAAGRLEKGLWKAEWKDCCCKK